MSLSLLFSRELTLCHYNMLCVKRMWEECKSVLVLLESFDGLFHGGLLALLLFSLLGLCPLWSARDFGFWRIFVVWCFLSFEEF